MRISNLHSRFRILASKPPATNEMLAEMETHFFGVPEEYCELMRDATEIELDVEGHYLRVWAPATCMDMDIGYQISKRLSGGIPVADDGGGRILVYFRGNKGRGLYRAAYGDLDPEETTWVCRTLDELLSQGKGLRELFG